MRQLCLVGCFVCVLAYACASVPPGPLATTGVRNFVAVNDDLSRGAQPTIEGFDTLSSRHVVTVLDLRPSGEDLVAFENEQRAAARLKLTFKQYPLSNWFAPSTSVVEQVLSVLNDPAMQPVFVHCERRAD